MKLAKAGLFAMVCMMVASPAWAAFNLDGLVQLVVWLIIVAVIVGILLFLVARAPFVPPEMKSIINYVIYFVCAIVLIYWLLGFAGGGGHVFR